MPPVQPGSLTLVAGASDYIGLLPAARMPSVKSVVYTSDQADRIQHSAGARYHIDESSWNEAAKAAWTLPVVQDHGRVFPKYCAKKIEAEQLSFKFVKEYNLHFTFNGVARNLNFNVLPRTCPQGQKRIARRKKNDKK
jgi:hypothetical protein